jgi:two-component system nitrate/nitrite response regulator NarL
MGVPGRILIVDDHEMLRRGVRSLLEAKLPWEVCGEAADGTEALKKVQELKPDLVILDVTMPAMNGLEAAVQIRRIAPSVKIVIFSMHDSPAMRAEFERVGADAFVVKSAPSGELITTVLRLLESAVGNGKAKADGDTAPRRPAAPPADPATP